MTVNVRIDDREIAVEAGSSILRAATEAGVHIPHICYEKNLSIKGSCRICLVEVEGNPKLQPACSTPVCEKMVVKTDSLPVREARKGVLELFLINHPLDCPVCDKGGECKLQDYVFQYGEGRGRFKFEKRTFAKEDVGPFVMRDMNRCVHCTRCVRFTSEITLTEDLGAFERGDHTSIGTYLGRELRNPFSGNVTELCPVGALTDRVFRFGARIWDLDEVPSACPLCPVGCLTRLQLRKGRILRVLSRKEGVSPWICDLGRFGFAATRPGLTQPVIRENGDARSVSLSAALNAVGRRFEIVLRESGPGGVGVFCSPSLTNEEIFAVQHVFRDVLGCNNMDSRLRAAAGITPEEAQVFSDALNSQGRIEELSGCESILLFCSDPCEETPIGGLELVRAVAAGGRVMSIGPREPSPVALSKVWLASTPEHSAFVLASIAGELAARSAATPSPDSGSGSAEQGRAGELRALSLEKAAELAGTGLRELDFLVREILSTPSLGLIVGREVFHGPSLYLTLAAMLRICAAREALGAGKTVLLSLLGEGNVRGALEFGAFPVSLHDAASASEKRVSVPGKSFDQMIEAARNKELKALFVFGGDPLSEYDNQEALREALANLDLLVVQNEVMNETAGMAHVYLPLQSVFEREGSFLTLEEDLKALTPQVSKYGTRSLLFDTLNSLSKATGHEAGFATADSVLEEMKKNRGWHLDGDLRNLAKGDGVRLHREREKPSPAWIAHHEFEKRKAAEAMLETRRDRGEEGGSKAPEYPCVLITGAAGVSSWVWAQHISGHESIPRKAFAEISQADADELGISSGTMIDIESPEGAIRVSARPTKGLMRGVVFVPQGFADARANILTGTGGPHTRVRVRKTSV